MASKCCGVSLTLKMRLAGMFDINQEIEIHYPVSTHVRYSQHNVGLKRRHFVVRRLRDLVAEPLTPEEYLRRPFVRRSRYLVVGTEIDANQWRQFYAGCSMEYPSPSQLRIALYEPGAKKPAKLLHRAFDATVTDREALRRWLLRNADDLQLRTG
jgi:hypothetical protein